MQLDTETASAILKSSAQCNAVAEEATRRVVELMMEVREMRGRITELEAELDSRPTQFAYDAATKALWHWRNEAARLGKKAAEEPRQMAHD